MESIQNIFIHKDSVPEETITKARYILSGLGINTFETSWYSFADSYFSVRLTDSLNYGTNGKGISKELALASAYAEFMERLQNRILYPDKYGNMDDVQPLNKDERKIKAIDLYCSHKELLDILFPTRFKEIESNELKCKAYFHVNKKKLTYLPDGIIKKFIGTNGMAAGNTMQEAMVQGICEIFERYAILNIVKNNLLVPDIPLDYFKEYPIFNLVDPLLNMGYSLIIKDCTFSSFIPVIGVIVFNKDKSKVFINFGSDSILEVALQRCLTEVFQGVKNSSSFENLKMAYVNLDAVNDLNNMYLDNDKVLRSNPSAASYVQYLISKIGNTFYIASGKPDFESAFEHKFVDHRESLNFLINKLKDKKYNIYIKDVSFLGFPSYHIYIPGMSEVYDENTFFTEINCSKIIKKVLLNLKESNELEIQDCISAIEDYLDIPYNKCKVYLKNNSSFIRAFVRIKSNSTDLFSLNYNQLLCLFNLRVKNYEKAYSNLSSFIKYLEELGELPDNILYYRCALMYLKYKSLNFSIQEIIEILDKIFGSKISEEVINDLNNPKNAFQYLKLPKCGNCNNCEVRGECNYKKWKDITSKINDKIKGYTVDVMKLSSLFE